MRGALRRAAIATVIATVMAAGGLAASAIATGTPVLAVGTTTVNGGGGGNSAATCVFTPNANGSVSAACTKGISNFTVTLCTGALPKVDVTDEHRTWVFGPYASPIVAVRIKAGTTEITFTTGVNCSIGTTTTTTSAGTTMARCPGTGNAAIAYHSLVIVGNVATATFTVVAGCIDIKVGIASYKAANGQPFPANLPQTLFDSKVGVFGPGQHTLTVNVPDCYAQTDLFTGDVIENLATNNFYGGRLLDSKLSNSTSCALGTTTTTPATTTMSTGTTTTPGTTTTTPATTTTPGTTTTTTTPTTTAARPRTATVKAAVAAKPKTAPKRKTAPFTPPTAKPKPTRTTLPFTL
jgi:hypothetical protein